MDSIKTTLKGIWNEKNFIPLILVIVCVYIVLSTWTTTIGRSYDISAVEGLERVEGLLGDISSDNEELLNINNRLEKSNEALIEENRKLTELTEQLKSDIDNYTTGLGSIGDYTLESELLIDSIRQLITRIEGYNHESGVSE